MSLPLCTRGLPCALEVWGEGGGAPAAPLRRAEAASMSCSAQDGCSALALRDVAVECGGGQAFESPASVDGVALVIEGGAFSGCVAVADGGAVQVQSAPHERRKF